MDWITCGACGLKHSRRADGLCPRCRTGVFGGAPPPPATPPVPTAYPVHGGATLAVPPAVPTAHPVHGGAVPPPAPSGWAPPLPTTVIAPPRGVARELEVGALVSRAFSTCWRDVWRYTAVMLLAYVPILVTAGLGVAAAVFVGGTGTRSPNLLRALVPWLVIGGVATFVMICAQMGGAAWATLQRLGGRPVTVGGMLGAGLRRAWPLFAANLLGAVLMMVGMLALIVPGIMVGVALTAVDAVVVAEGAGPGQAIERSFALTKGSRWTLFGALLVMGLATWGINMGASLLGAALRAGGSGPGVLGTILSLLVQAAVGSLFAVLSTVAYHDLRLAKEGVDTSALERVFE
jgi:hypothetical protein